MEMPKGYLLVKYNNVYKKVCVLFLAKKVKMYYGTSVRRSTVKRATRRTTRRAKYGTGDKSNTSGVGTKTIQTKRSPAFAKNLGNALHVDRPLVQGGALPATLYAKHRYSEQVILYADNLTNRTGTEIAFRLNSLFDPNFTGTGHQPLGYDQFSALYTLYRVYKVEVNIRLTGKFGAAVTYMAVNVRPSLSTYSLGSLKKGDEVNEQPGNTIMDGSLNQSWSQSYYIADIEGCSRQRVMTDDQYNAGVGANPFLTPYLSVVAGTWDEPASASNGVYACVNFVFHTQWSNPKPLPQS